MKSGERWEVFSNGTGSRAGVMEGHDTTTLRCRRQAAVITAQIASEHPLSTDNGESWFRQDNSGSYINRRVLPGRAHPSF